MVFINKTMYLQHIAFCMEMQLVNSAFWQVEIICR